MYSIFYLNKIIVLFENTKNLVLQLILLYSMSTYLLFFTIKTFIGRLMNIKSQYKAY